MDKLQELQNIRTELRQIANDLSVHHDFLNEYVRQVCMDAICNKAFHEANDIIQKVISNLCDKTRILRFDKIEKIIDKLDEVTYK